MDVGSLIGGGGLVTLILAGGAAVKWWVGRLDSQKDPIPKDQAAMALSASAVELMQAVASEMRAEVGNLRVELSGARGKIGVLENRVSASEGTIEHHERLFGAAMSYIEALLRHIRDGRKQPPPPVPSDIRDLIDPDLHA